MSILPVFTDRVRCYAGHSVSSAKRVEALQQFNNPETKVCLLDLRLGARGLNLVIANRLIFLAPVWSLDVQAQAIKRVHRIGQTRPTTIEVLVTSGTFEEDIADRSSVSRSEKEEQVYSRALIEVSLVTKKTSFRSSQRPRFVYAESDEDDRFKIRFIPQGDQPATSDGTLSESILDTPSTPIRKSRVALSPRIVSPTPTEGVVKLEHESKVGLKRSVVQFALEEVTDEDGAKPRKKRAKVAFV